jgi:hypothetical protein
MVSRLKRAVHALDHGIGRIGGARRVLVDLRTPVCQAVLGPVWERLEQRRGVSVSFTSEYPERITPLLGGRTCLPHSAVEWGRFDLYLNADPWAAARLRRCAARVNFFHGVAGKYDLDQPSGLPMGFEYYDRVAFINRDRMDNYLASGVVTPAQARLVGYPKLDHLVSGGLDGHSVRAGLGLDPARATALYAPTYSTASSLHLAGEQIIGALADAGCNVIVKLHDRSLDKDPRYTGGIDWRARMRALERPGRIRYVEGPDASPWLAAAHLMVTDHSSVGFEFLTLDRPLIVFDAPDLASAARINPQKVRLLRSAAVVVGDVSGLRAAAAAAVADPAHLTAERRHVVSQVFHDPGRATVRALAVLDELLNRTGETPQAALPHATTARPRC